MKKIIIRWAFRAFKKAVEENPKMTYRELESYGVQDWTVVSVGEKAYIL
jgi:hypothetical protein